MRSLTSRRAIYLKGALFLLVGLSSAALLLLEQPTPKVAFLLAVCVWAFARAYYFAFYVVERYVDPGFKFSGLWAFVRYLMRRK
jgi:hypothetical protein